MPPTLEQRQAAFAQAFPGFQRSVAPAFDVHGITRCDGLILPATGQPETAAFLIGALKPPRIAYIPTPGTESFKSDTQAFLPDLAAYIEECLQAFPQTATPDDTGGVYTSLKAILKAWPEDGIYFVDVTGGRKPMSVGLAQAAHLFAQVHAVYVGSQFDTSSNKFVDGTQYFTFIPDPYTVFGDLEAQAAINHFAMHDYPNGQRMFAELGHRLPPATGGAYYQALALLCDAYTAWDGFELGQAYTTLQATQQALQSIPMLKQVTAHLERHVQVLNPVMDLILAPRPNKDDQVARARFHRKCLEQLRQPVTAAGLLAMFYTNAQRRAAQGKFDTAALMLYRSLELVSQHRLTTHGILAENPEWGMLKERHPEIEYQYDTAYRSLGLEGGGKLRGKITLIMGYVLLYALNDPVARACNIKQMQELSNIRNQSILAHGFEFVDESDYKLFQALVDAAIAAWQQHEPGMSWETIRADCTLVRDGVTVFRESA